jgi:hypothetical protein
MNTLALTYGPILIGGAVAFLCVRFISFSTRDAIHTNFSWTQAQWDRCSSMYNILQIVSRRVGLQDHYGRDRMVRVVSRSLRFPPHSPFRM